MVCGALVYAGYWVVTFVFGSDRLALRLAAIAMGLVALWSAKILVMPQWIAVLRSAVRSPTREMILADVQGIAEIALDLLKREQAGDKGTDDLRSDLVYCWPFIRRALFQEELQANHGGSLAELLRDRSALRDVFAVVSELLPSCDCTPKLKQMDADFLKLCAGLSLREKIQFVPYGSTAEDYNGRLLVVLRAETQDDLKRLYETLESTRVADLHVLIVWPTTIPLPPPPDAPVTCLFWHGSLSEFAQALITAEIPLASDSPKWSILVGRRSLQFEAREIQRALKRFAILTEKDLLPPEPLDMADVQEFLEGSISNWSAFCCGLPAPRAYRSESDLTLEEEVQESFQSLREGSETLTSVIEMPCEAGRSHISTKIACVFGS